MKSKASATKGPKAATKSRAVTGNTSKAAATKKATTAMDEDDDFEDVPKPQKTLKAPSRQGKDASDIYQSVRPYAIWTTGAEL